MATYVSILNRVKRLPTSLHENDRWWLGANGEKNRHGFKQGGTSVKVAILCGGLGTRLREETEYRPKPMVDIGGRPILWHIMKLYAHHGYRDFVLCLGYRGHMIKEYFLNYQAMNSDFPTSLRPKHRPEFPNHH